MTTSGTSAVTYRSLLSFPAGRDELFEHLDEQLRSWLVSKDVPWDGGLAGTRRTSTFTIEATEHHERDGSRTNAIRCTEQTPLGSWNVRLTAHRAAHAEPWLLTEVVSPLGPDSDRALAAAPPRLMRQLLDVLPARDGRTSVTGGPAYVGADDVDQVVQAVLDPSRRGLLFVAGTPADFPTETWCAYIARLVRDTVGLAATFVLDPEATQLARAALGSHGPDVGYLRTYLRDVRPHDAADAARHRFLTPRTMTERPDGYLRRVLSGTARQQVVDRPVPPDVTRVLRRVARWHADEPDLSLSTPVGTSSATAAPGDAETLRTALRDAAAAASAQAERLRQQVDELELDLLRQDEQLQALQSERDDALLDATAATDEAQAAADQVRYLRTQLMQGGAGEAAWTDVPSEQRTTLPESVSELLERLGELRHVVFTGDEQAALDLDVTDTLGRSARKAWQALLALDDFARLKSDAAFTGTAHDYCRETPGGYHGWSAERHACDESEQVKANGRFANARLLPVPESVDPSGYVYMWAHFKLAAHRTVSPRMHYYDDTGSSGKVYVGYLGRHLPNTQTN
ncbi:MAG: hypothetical protein M3P93_06060 [Actinomycetota bacterium]|nr:hypothetical protein [Actinomycetota bacterium]